MTLYVLPHNFTISEDEHQPGAYVLWCGGNFSFWAETLDEILIVYGKHLAHVKG